MKKKILALFILGVLLFTVTGCLDKKAITTEQFKKIAEKNNLIVTDVKNQFADFDYVYEATVAVSPEGYQIEFYVLSDVTNAQGMYTKNKNRFESEDTSSKKSVVNLNNYTKYTQQTKESYKVLSRIDNTMIYVSESVKNKDKINKILKELGY